MRLRDLLNYTKTSISKNSFNNFSKYFADKEDEDDQDEFTFEAKLQKIYDLILNEKVTDLNFITKESGCGTLEECVLKIRYLENKRIIENHYIDLNSKTVKKCSIEDEKLLQKYCGFIYNQHLQIDEITLKLPTTTNKNYHQEKERVYQEILYLYDKYLLNGIRLNKVDRYISYYTIDKKRQKLDVTMIKCPNCGANNELKRYTKVRDLLFSKYEREASIEEISAFMDIPCDKLVSIIESVAFTREMEFDCSDDNRELVDNKILIDNELSLLDAFSKSLINCRYYQGFTQCETAEILGVSQVKVSREEKLILSRMRSNII